VSFSPSLGPAELEVRTGDCKRLQPTRSTWEGGSFPLPNLRVSICTRYHTNEQPPGAGPNTGGLRTNQGAHRTKGLDKGRRPRHVCIHVEKSIGPDTLPSSLMKSDSNQSRSKTLEKPLRSSRSRSGSPLSPVPRGRRNFPMVAIMYRPSIYTEHTNWTDRSRRPCHF
jgi:hypothetical protein